MNTQGATAVAWGGEVGPFGFPNTLHTIHEESDSNTDNVTLATAIARNITLYGTGSISVVGVLLKVLELWVWSSKRKFQAIVFLFKSLAVADIVFLVAFNAWWYSPSGTLAQFVLMTCLLAAQAVVVNVTLATVACRWCTVLHRCQACLRATPFRVRLAVTAVVAWCVLLRTVERLVVYHTEDRRAAVVVGAVTAGVVLAAPCLMLTGLALSLVLETCRGPKVDPTPLPSARHLYHRDRHGRRSSLHTGPEKFRRLTYTIVLMAALTFLSYPVGVTVHGYLVLTVTTHPARAAHSEIWFSVVFLLQVLTSSVRFCLYAALVLRFRKLLLLKVITAYTGNYQSTATATTAEDVGNYLDAGNNEVRASLPHPADRRISSFHQSVVCLTQEGALLVTGLPLYVIKEISEGSFTRSHEYKSSPSADWATMAPQRMSHVSLSDDMNELHS